MDPVAAREWSTLNTVEILKAIADETRLRMLMVLDLEPLSVQEVQEVLDLRQSRVSRHLKILERAQILESHRDGSHIYYGLTERRGLRALLAAIGVGSAESDQTLPVLPSAREDRMRLEGLLGNRRAASHEHFQRYGKEQDRQQSGLVDAEFYRGRVLDLLPPESGLTLDLGCGTGELAGRLAGRVDRLVCVDQSANMLEVASRKVRLDNVEFRLGNLERLPLRDGEAQTVVASMVLHHLPDPLVGLREIRRVLAPQGRLLVADLASHKEEIMRSRFADFWLGFSADRLREMIEAAGFEIISSANGRGNGSIESIFLLAGCSTVVEPAKSGVATLVSS